MSGFVIGGHRGKPTLGRLADTIITTLALGFLIVASAFHRGRR